MRRFLVELVSLGERQGKNEKLAAEKMIKVLEQSKVPYQIQTFQTFVPDYKKAELIADGKKIPIKPTCFVSGKIKSKNAIISSLISSQRFIKDSNINFNPCCREFSRSNHYFAPSVAVRPKDLQKICDAKKVTGEVIVKKQKHTSKNILVGNLKNPKNILFCHYDSIGPGAVDNASGTAVLLELILSYPETLKNNLYVIAGNEELSYDKPLYWGFGYRVFEKRYPLLLKNAKQIFCVDCVGNGTTVFDQNIAIVRLGLPIKNLRKYISKTYAVYGDFEKLMEVYHGDNDTLDKVQDRYLQDAVKSLYKRIH